MKVAIIGLPQSGKTTLFQALVGTLPSREKGATILGTLKVSDPRVDFLASIYNPRKVEYASIGVVEVQPQRQSDGKDKGLDSSVLNLVKPADALLLVVRAFDEEGLNDPMADVRGIIEDLILTDLFVVGQRIERLENDAKKGKQINKEEMEVLRKAYHLLEQGERVIEDKGVAENIMIRQYALLTGKPIFVIINLREDALNKGEAEIIREFGISEMNLPLFLCCAKLEKEIRELPEEERGEFLDAMGIKEPVLDKIVREIYKELGLISFFTVGEDECRAWPIRKGTVAVKAAGVVHSDMERGFIRAEVISFEDFERYKSESAARKAGKYRLEGKDYVMQDGDIVHFRFNV